MSEIRFVYLKIQLRSGRDIKFDGSGSCELGDNCMVVKCDESAVEFYVMRDEIEYLVINEIKE